MDHQGFLHLMLWVRAEQAAIANGLIAGEVGKTVEEIALQTVSNRMLFRGLGLLEAVIDNALSVQKEEEKAEETE